MMKKIPFLAGLLTVSAMFAQGPSKTTFQTGSTWNRFLDNRADAVMVYSTGDNSSLSKPNVPFEDRVAAWREKGYTTHFMTGIAWGEYKDYFLGEWDGKRHLDEGQVQMSGDTIWHGWMVPYIVPTRNYLDYFKERQIRRVIDAGIDDIFLEEPEFWARAGYSEAFRREWKAYYGTPWQAQHESPQATYMSSKLKYHLYYRALNEVFTYAKEYGRSLGREIRCYVPTHSLLNYAQWQIVSPEASLALLPCVDGYIAQVWSGTAREPAYYDGNLDVRTFETAYLEYGCMASMTAPTGRRMWFLTDPLEDVPRNWPEYKRNYQATFTAQMLYPQVVDYEIMPWPERIYLGRYRRTPDSQERIRIPEDFATMMQVMINTARLMPGGGPSLDGSHGIAVLMCNSLMFQRFPSHEGYDDPFLSNFMGLAMPLIKRGIPVETVHMENLSFDKTLRGVKVLLMSYSNMKPMEKESHQYLADWVKRGGHLIYASEDNDPFQDIQEWWNSGDCAFARPADHLFSLIGMEAGAGEGTYRYGKGSVTVIRCNPKEFVMRSGGDAPLVEAVSASYGKSLQQKNFFHLDRGPYKLVAVLDESVSKEPYHLRGCYIDLYDPSLPVVSRRDILPGTQCLLYDVRKAPKAPCILASAGRSYDETATAKSFSYICKGPEETLCVTRILLPSPPVEVLVNGKKADLSWDAASKTCLVKHPNSPEGVSVSLRW